MYAKISHISVKIFDCSKTNGVGVLKLNILI